MTDGSSEKIAQTQHRAHKSFTYIYIYIFSYVLETPAASKSSVVPGPGFPRVPF
jgi:hypothetical protein